MKTKLMAFILAAGLGITGIAVTAQAQAAGAKAEEPCRHETLHYFSDFQRAFYYDPTYHISVFLTGYKCSNDRCSYMTMVKEIEISERHDYEQTYYPDGKVESKCLGCHDSYYW